MRIPELLGGHRNWRSLAAVAVVSCLVLALVAVPDAHAQGDDDIRIIALGDSFIAGVGAGNYYPNQGTDSPDDGDGVARVPGDGRNCYQSYSSYPWQLTELINQSGGTAAVWHEACIGAHVDDILGPPGMSSGQVDRVPEEWWDAADLVLVSAGGNDGGFATIAEACIYQGGQLPAHNGQSCRSALSDAESLLAGGFEDELARTLEEILNRARPGAQFAIMGYPFLSDPPDRLSCAGAFEERLTALQEMHNRIITNLASAHPDFHAITVSGQFKGRGPCADNDRWVNFVTPSAFNESFHPSFRGHQEYAKILFEAQLVRPQASNPTVPGGAVSTALIIDSSGSMSDNDPQNRRLDAAAAYLNVAPSDDEVGVISFTTTSSIVSEAVSVGANRSELRSKIKAIQSSGGTDLGEALLAGCDVLAQATGQQRAAIFLTDGQGSYNDEVQCYAAKGWKVFTIGLGSGVDAPLLQEIASASGGMYRQLSGATNIVCEFQQIRAAIAGESTGTCEPTASISQGETVSFSETVSRVLRQITFTNIWLGSDIEMTVVGPDGRRIDRKTSAIDVLIDVGSSFETITVLIPAQGEWVVDLFGADIPASGEPFSFSTVRLVAEAPPPTTVPPVAPLPAPQPTAEQVTLPIYEPITVAPPEPVGAYGFGNQGPVLGETFAAVPLDSTPPATPMFEVAVVPVSPSEQPTGVIAHSGSTSPLTVAVGLLLVGLGAVALGVDRASADARRPPMRVRKSR